MLPFSVITLSALAAPALSQTAQNISLIDTTVLGNLPSVEQGINTNFADPAIWRDDPSNTWYSFATRLKLANGSINVQVASSPNNFNSWSLHEGYDALPQVADWAYQDEPKVWAPDIILNDNHEYVMYYAATYNTSRNQHCVGAAKAQTITGPYEPVEDTLFCDVEAGGAIDASGFIDADGSRYIVYKVDGNSVGHGKHSSCTSRTVGLLAFQTGVTVLRLVKGFTDNAAGGLCGNMVDPIVPTPIMLQAVEGDGITKKGQEIQLLDRDMNDGPLIEAPSLVRTKDGKYVLFFSSGCYMGQYDLTYAMSDSLTGPYTKYGPLARTGTDGLYAPGGASISVDGEHMVFHANVSAGVRPLYVATVNIDTDKKLVSFAT